MAQLLVLDGLESTRGIRSVIISLMGRIMSMLNCILRIFILMEFSRKLRNIMQFYCACKKINFLHSFNRCDDDTYSDYVELSNYIPIDRKYDRKCGTVESGFKVESDRKFFRVNFKSNDRYDATGFQATYQFTDKVSYKMISNYYTFRTNENCFYDKANTVTVRNVRNSAPSMRILNALIPILLLYVNLIVVL